MHKLLRHAPPLLHQKYNGIFLGAKNYLEIFLKFDIVSEIYRWPNSFRLQKWTRQPEFKFWIWLFAFHFPANILRKGMNPFPLPQLRVNRKTATVLGEFTPFVIIEMCWQTQNPLTLSRHSFLSTITRVKSFRWHPGDTKPFSITESHFGLLITSWTEENAALDWIGV